MEQQITRQRLDANSHGAHNQQAIHGVREQQEVNLEGLAGTLGIHKLGDLDHKAGHSKGSHKG